MRGAWQRSLSATWAIVAQYVADSTSTGTTRVRLSSTSIARQQQKSLESLVQAWEMLSGLMLTCDISWKNKTDVTSMKL